MLGFNVTAQTYSYDNRPVVPLYNMPFSQWWMVSARDNALRSCLLTCRAMFSSTATSTTHLTQRMFLSSLQAVRPRFRSPATRATQTTTPLRRGASETSATSWILTDCVLVVTSVTPALTWPARGNRQQSSMPTTSATRLGVLLALRTSLTSTTSNQRTL